MIKILILARYLTIFFSVFFTFFYMSTNPSLARKISLTGMVGIIGLLSFITHVIFHKADAKRLGWETDRPDWQFEVGFANLAFSLAAFLSFANLVGSNTGQILMIAYALYLFQAGILHGIRAFQTHPINYKKLFLSSGLTFLFVFFLVFFSFKII